MLLTLTRSPLKFFFFRRVCDIIEKLLRDQCPNYSRQETGNRIKREVPDLFPVLKNSVFNNKKHNPDEIREVLFLRDFATTITATAIPEGHRALAKRISTRPSHVAIHRRGKLQKGLSGDRLITRWEYEHFSVPFSRLLLSVAPLPIPSKQKAEVK